ncbi:biotin/lipoyl-containing protein [Erysipelothrix urinaevulpis]|uniref:acetyl-CoA carboxylase biotin carboxyl carrier protein n=1 Tax=Erysipelothrix urinaevulpis TaxID=2683717 RepID=UPI00135C13FF|nr:biotin/lipoyl-containing protein [Erysipelothrix urinaevulpis]
MNLENIEKLMQILEESNLESLSYKDKNFELCLHKAKEGLHVSQPVIAEKSSTNPVDIIDENDKVKSPLVGVYYSKPAPTDESFVSVNQTVKKGQTLCIIESMKVMNEIKAHKDGNIGEIYLKDGEMVDYDQPLFLIQ